MLVSFPLCLKLVQKIPGEEAVKCCSAQWTLSSRESGRPLLWSDVWPRGQTHWNLLLRLLSLRTLVHKVTPVGETAVLRERKYHFKSSCGFTGVFIQTPSPIVLLCVLFFLIAAGIVRDGGSCAVLFSLITSWICRNFVSFCRNKERKMQRWLESNHVEVALCSQTQL